LSGAVFSCKVRFFEYKNYYFYLNNFKHDPMTTNSHIDNPASTNNAEKKSWHQPSIVLISSDDIEKNGLATKEAVAPGVFTPKSVYHS
jgi:hypothetical protein